jgi:hypothetical protein
MKRILFGLSLLTGLALAPKAAAQSVTITVGRLVKTEVRLLVVEVSNCAETALDDYRADSVGRDSCRMLGARKSSNSF